MVKTLFALLTFSLLLLTSFADVTVCRVTDAFRNGLESPYRLSEDRRTLSVKLEPRGFVLIEDALGE